MSPTTTRRTFLFVAGSTLLAASSARAAKPVTYTTIQVSDMHCADCAKKIAKKLYAVPGVLEVRADVPKNIAYVVPGKEKNIPPKALWEAVVKSGFKPIKLEGPDGTFTKQPE